MSEDKTEANSADDSPCLDLTIAVPLLKGNGWRGLLRRSLEKVLGIKAIRQLFADASKKAFPNPFARSLQLTNIAVDAEGVIDAIPANGGAIIIANHPFGGADAVAFSSLCIKKRADSKILANSMMKNAPGIGEYLMPLKILNEENAARHNLKTLKEASKHVSNGGVLGVFPAGAISKYISSEGEITDPEWSEHIARIALRTKVPVVPVFFYGKNSLIFQILGSLNGLLRAALIPRGYLALENKSIKCRAGKMISHEELAKAEDPTNYLRNAVYKIEHSA